jgi:hypothetical protein
MKKDNNNNQPIANTNTTTSAKTNKTPKGGDKDAAVCSIGKSLKNKRGRPPS